MNEAPQLPPIAPGALPLFGHALFMAGGSGRLAFLQRVREYGPLVRISIGPKIKSKKVAVVNDPALIHEILTVEADSFSKGLLFEKLKMFGGDPLPVAEGQAHLKRRREMQPPFHKEAVTSYVGRMFESVQTVVQGWSEGRPLDLKTEMQLISQSVVMSSLFSSTPEPELARRILDSVDIIFMTALRRALVPLPLLQRLPTRGNRRAAAATSLLSDVVADIVKAHRERPDDGHHDVVSLLMNVQDDAGRPLDSAAILAEVIALLAAGSETTGGAMGWLFHELGRHPELERRLHEEVDSVVGEGPLTAEHIPQLTYTARLVREILRLYSPWLVTRQATKSVELGGRYVLPAGTDVIFSPYALHRDPGIYPDPTRFDPDRWQPQRVQPPRNAYIPFGSGKRMCIGDAFALTEATVIVAVVAGRYRLRPLQGTVVRPVGEITTHPSTLRMIPQARYV